MPDQDNRPDTEVNGPLRPDRDDDPRVQLDEITVLQDVQDADLTARAFEIEPAVSGDEEALLANPLLGANNRPDDEGLPVAPDVPQGVADLPADEVADSPDTEQAAQAAPPSSAPVPIEIGSQILAAIATAIGAAPDQEALADTPQPATGDVETDTAAASVPLAEVAAAAATDAVSPAPVPEADPEDDEPDPDDDPAPLPEDSEEGQTDPDSEQDGDEETDTSEESDGETDTGTGDAGTGDTGDDDTGTGDTGDDDTGTGDTGDDDTGPGDTGDDDTGTGDTGDDDTGPGDTGGDDTGTGDTGDDDTGTGNTGDDDTGTGDTGGDDTGTGDTGDDDTGTGDTGDDDTGTGDTGGDDTDDDDTDGDDTGTGDTGDDDTGDDDTGDDDTGDGGNNGNGNGGGDGTDDGNNGHGNDPDGIDESNPAFIRMGMKAVGGGSAKKNSIGAYAATEDGTIVEADIMVENTQDMEPGDEFNMVTEGTNELFYFVVEDGFTENWDFFNGEQPEGHFEFCYKYGTEEQRLAKISDDGADVRLMYVTENEAFEIQGNVFHGEPNLNADGHRHVRVEATETGFMVSFEDHAGLGDGDFDDAVFSVTMEAGGEELLEAALTEAGPDGSELAAGDGEITAEADATLAEDGTDGTSETLVESDAVLGDDDGNNGHGNDADGVDESNPTLLEADATLGDDAADATLDVDVLGEDILDVASDDGGEGATDGSAPLVEADAVLDGDDGNNGHGNDADGVDESNPVLLEVDATLGDDAADATLDVDVLGEDVLDVTVEDGTVDELLSVDEEFTLFELDQQSSDEPSGSWLTVTLDGDDGVTTTEADPGGGWLTADVSVDGEAAAAQESDSEGNLDSEVVIDIGTTNPPETEQSNDMVGSLF